ncbi:MAG TPA: mitochondrial fission ELM1 family protein [Micropepsaceae bacterium]|nr:mitochondrial fission ELM1 family protein [Micropepsaceae bacterium]
MPDPDAAPAIWVVSEGHAGMENQGIGLAEALGLPFVVKRVRFRFPWSLFAPRIPGNVPAKLAAGSSAITPPWPRILIGIGRQSIPVSIAVKKLSGGRTFTVQTQAPRFRLDAFDLVVPPLHDNVEGPNVFPVIGAPHRISDVTLAKARNEFAARFAGLHLPRIAVLIGGNSKAHGLSDVRAATIAQQLSALARGGASLMVTLSRRTPESAARIIRTALQDTSAFVWDGTGANPYIGLLAHADAILVTEDSVAMMTEAAATGAPVHLIALDGGKPKFDSFKAELIRRGIARPFTGALEHWNYAPLRETARIAAKIREEARL